MKNRFKRIIIIVLTFLTSVCLGYATFVFIKDKFNNKEYILNDNERYLISNYDELIEDINLFDEKLFLIDSFFSMEIKDNYIISLDISFVNEDNSRLYYLKIKETNNKLTIEEKENVINKTVTMNDYFEACYLGYQELKGDTCTIESELYLGNNIIVSDKNFFYSNSAINPVVDSMGGTFLEIKFSDLLEKNINIYIEI